MTNEDKAQIIIAEVCRFYNTTTEVINSKCRRRELVEPRQMIFYFMKGFTGLNLTDIGAYFGKDHSTVIHSCRTINDLIDANGYGKKTNIMAGRINFNISKFELKKNQQFIEKWALSIAQF